MNKLEKTYRNLSDAQPTIIFADVSQRVAFEYAFTIKAMEEMAWQAWLRLDKEWHDNDGIPFSEEYSIECFNEWLKEQV